MTLLPLLLILKEPDLLILDEPANGLDPVGMREVRRLLRRLADEGRTVFVSAPGGCASNMATNMSNIAN